MVKNFIYRNKTLLKSKFFNRFCSIQREQIECDVLIVGGGPAGLSSAIRLKQLQEQYGKEINVCVIDKGSEIGSQILSGNCFQPDALNELFPEWKSMENGPPLNTPVSRDQFLYLRNQNQSIKVPNFLLPKQVDNHGNYIISLGNLCKWLSEKSQELGIDIFSSFSGNEVLYNDQGAVVGVVTGDLGIEKNGEIGPNFQPGVEIRAKQTIFAEGARGSLSERVIKNFDLRKNSEVQLYGLGIKEVWEIQPEKFESGLVQHTIGWPLDNNTYGGSFMYHMNPNLVHIGMVIGLDYQNAYLSPYEEFQKFKTHLKIKEVLDGGSCISYGARTLNEGGYHSLPKLTFPGGMLVGCSAGFLNLMKIKGSHNAMKSGMVAAEQIYQKLAIDNKESIEIKEYEDELKKTWVYQDLYLERNVKGAFKYGLIPGVVYAGLTSFIMKGKEPWNIKQYKKDSQAIKPIKDCQPIDYPKKDGKLTFDLLENLSRSGTNHEHNQPAHLKIKSEYLQSPQKSYNIYGGIEQRFCPAKVYEFIVDEKNEPKLQINAQNCLHCKACSIKMVDEYIDWNVPEGGGGPNYSGM